MEIESLFSFDTMDITGTLDLTSETDTLANHSHERVTNGVQMIEGCQSGMPVRGTALSRTDSRRRA
jgi:hypothetical protein